MRFGFVMMFSGERFRDAPCDRQGPEKYASKRNESNHLRSTGKTGLPGLHLADLQRA
jgi:hypothetical protein